MKTEDKDPASTTQTNKLQQLGNCNAEPCRRVIQHHLTSMCVCVCIQDSHEDQENTLLCLRTIHSKEEFQGSSQTKTSHGGASWNSTVVDVTPWNYVWTFQTRHLNSSSSTRNSYSNRQSLSSSDDGCSTRDPR